MVIFLEPPVQVMLAFFKSEPYDVVSMEVTETVLAGPPAKCGQTRFQLCCIDFATATILRHHFQSSARSRCLMPHELQC